MDAADRGDAGTPTDRLWLSGLGIVLIAALAVGLAARRELPWDRFTTGDELEYAELGRRLADGRGFTSGTIYPSQVRWGIHDRHPSLVRAPLWPMLLAGVFSLTGPEEAAAHVANLACFAVTAGLVYALAAALGGPAIGLVAGLAAATTADVLTYALFAGTETLFALWITLFFWGVVTRRDGFWIGVTAGLAYLTRYNGGLLLPLGLLLLLRWPLPIGPMSRCVAGFSLLVVPWWLRNFVVTGEPFYSLYGITLFFTTDLIPHNSSLNHMIDPDLTSAAAMSPWVKVRQLLPEAIAHWPPATANLAALAGVALGTWRRDRPCLAVLGLTAVTTVLISFMALRGRYLIPFVPAMIALGAAAWWRFGGRMRAPALAVLLLAPVLPTFPSALSDTRLAHGYLDGIREQSRSAVGLETPFAVHFASCLADRPLVIAQNAPAVTWAADNVTVYMTRTEEDFWRLVDENPVAYVRLAERHPLQRSPEFRERFLAAEECGPSIYRRRTLPGTPPAQ